MTNSLRLQEKKVKVLTTGSRKYSDYSSVGRAIVILIKDLVEQGIKEITFMQGACRGADKHVVEFVNKIEKSLFERTGVKIRYESFPPDLVKYGSPGAYHIRNQEMVNEKPIHALVFLEKNEKNSGTLSVVKKLNAAGISYTAYGATELLDKL